MKAILLAAGRGKRLQWLTAGRPKSLLEFGGETLLARHLRGLRQAGVEEIGVVTGYQAAQVKDELLAAGCICPVHEIFNPHYEHGSALSVLAASGFASGSDFLLLDADVLCGPEMLLRLAGADAPNCLLVDQLAVDTGEEVKVVIEPDGRVSRLAKLLPPSTGVAGESVGFFKFQTEAGRRLFEILTGLSSAEPETEYEAGIDRLLEEIRFEAIDIHGLPWIEIDFPEDLERALKEVYPRL